MLVIKDQKDFNAFIRVTLEHLNKSTKRPHIKRRELEQAVSPALSKGKSHAVLSSELKANKQSSILEAIKEIESLLPHHLSESYIQESKELKKTMESILKLEFNILHSDSVDGMISGRVESFFFGFYYDMEGDLMPNIYFHKKDDPLDFLFEEDRLKEGEIEYSFGSNALEFDFVYNPDNTGELDDTITRIKPSDHIIEQTLHFSEDEKCQFTQVLKSTARRLVDSLTYNGPRDISVAKNVEILQKLHSIKKML